MGQFLCPMFKENVTVNGLKYVVVKGIGEGGKYCFAYLFPPLLNFILLTSVCIFTMTLLIMEVIAGLGPV